MISFNEARQFIQGAAKGMGPLAVEAVPLKDIPGRICAQEILAPLSVQPFDNSAMDGFAVRLADLDGASSLHPVMLKKVGVVAAGDAVPHDPLEAGCCVHIMTGAPVMPGVEAVVPIEHVEVSGEAIRFTAVPKLNANIRFSGEDFKQGEVIFKTGGRFDSAHVLALATLGVETVQVFKKPRVAFIATGRELVDDLSTPLESGQIYNSNRPYALSVLKSMGVDVVTSLTVRDDASAFSDALAELEALGVDMIISSGAVSAGAFDFVRTELELAGAHIVFHKVKLKPGKPNLLAKLPSGALYFGLPGNPVATAVGLRFFVEPAIRARMERPQEEPFYARALNEFTKNPDLHMFLKAKTDSQKDGSLGLHFLDGQESFMVSPFLTMNAWACVEEGVGHVKRGDVVKCYPQTGW